MPQRPIAPSAQRSLREAWQRVYGSLRKINQDVLLKPTSPSDVIRLLDSSRDQAKFVLGPIVLFLPYKLSARSNEKVYAVIEGSLTLERSDREEFPRTSHYATHIAYFKPQDNKLIHVFGAHYDFDPRIAHPVFHVQISSHAKYAESVAQKIHSIVGLADDGDKVRGLMGNIRVPTAQMDFFAVFLQVCSDHLVNEKSTSEDRSHYKQIRELSWPFLSYGPSHTGLCESNKNRCFRSQYWYGHPV